MMNQTEFRADCVALVAQLGTTEQEVVRGLNGSVPCLVDWTLERTSEGSVGGDQSTVVGLLHPPVRVLIGQSSSSSSSDAEVHDDPDCVSVSSFVCWHLRVRYSETWRVPVLYFIVENDHGEVLDRSEVLQLVCEAKQRSTGGMNNGNDNDTGDTDTDTDTDVGDDASWDFISYDEDPTSGKPSLFLHPCQTSGRMKLLRENRSTHDTNRILCWLSMVLPAVGFRIPSRVFANVHNTMLRDDENQEWKEERKA